MKNIFLILCFLLSLSSCSQTSEKNNKQGLLWKISGNGLEQPSYLFGTAHSFSDRFLERVSLFHNAFDSVQQLVVELDSINVEQMQSLSQAYKLDRFLPKEIKYSDLLDRDDIIYLDSILMKYWNTTSDKIAITPNALYEEIKKKYIEDERILEDFSLDSIPENSPLRFIVYFDKDRFYL